MNEKEEMSWNLKKFVERAQNQRHRKINREEKRKKERETYRQTELGKAHEVSFGKFKT